MSEYFGIEHPGDTPCLVTMQRNYSGWHLLRQTATHALDHAEDRTFGRTNCLTAIVTTAIALEALSNSLLQEVFGESWKDFERSSTMAKLRLLCQVLGVAWDKDSEPWSSVRWLINLRNEIVHSKPHDLEIKQIQTWDEANRTMHAEQPLSKIEKELTKEGAERAVGTATTVRDLFLQKRPRPDLSTDYWIKSISAEEAKIEAFRRSEKKKQSQRAKHHARSPEAGK